MNIYYVPNSRTEKYNLESVLSKGCKEIYQIKSEIEKDPDFCRDEESINTYDLKSYLNSGFTLYSSDLAKNLTGILNFDINEPSIYIYGLCVPNYAKGTGTQLINALKRVAEVNHLNNIKLDCYGSVVNFYLKNGFEITDKSEFYEDSYNSEDESNNAKIKYKMIYNLNVKTGIGGRKKKTNKIRKNRKTIKIRQSKRKTTNYKSNRRNKRTKIR